MDTIESWDRQLRQSVTADPLQALTEIAAIKAMVGERERDAVHAALPDHSLRAIGEALGVSKQAVFQRFGKEWVATLKRTRSRTEWRDEIRHRVRD